MIPKPFDKIEFSDILELETKKAPESKTLEYKSQLPDQKKSEGKKKFLAEVAAFANTAGGDIIFGVEEERDSRGRPTGIPKEVTGLLECENVDSEILRLGDMIRSGLEPHPPGFRIEKIGDGQNGPVILLRIPKSWSAPHMIKIGDSRFYYRTDRGKHPMDVQEIRLAFLASESLDEMITNFRTERVGKILAGESPITLKDGPTVILHIVPVGSLVRRESFGLPEINKHASILAPTRWGGRSARTNYDGLLIYPASIKTVNQAYIQVFRNSSIEIVDSDIANIETLWIHSDFLVNKMVEYIAQVLYFEERLNNSPPCVVLVSLVNIAKYSLATRVSADRQGLHQSDRNEFLFPDILADDYGVDSPKLLRPVFDMIWQSFGFSNYSR